MARIDPNEVYIRVTVAKISKALLKAHQQLNRTRSEVDPKPDRCFCDDCEAAREFLTRLGVKEASEL